MARPLELILELDAKKSKSFAKKMENPPRNPARDKTLARVKAMSKRVHPLL